MFDFDALEEVDGRARAFMQEPGFDEWYRSLGALVEKEGVAALERFWRLYQAKPSLASIGELSQALKEPDTFEGARVLYSVRLVVHAPYEAVWAALEGALEGDPPRVDGRRHAELFVAPPPIAPEWVADCKDDSTRIMPELGRRALTADMHAASIPMGLRPLLHEEKVQPLPASKGWCRFVVGPHQRVTHQGRGGSQRAEESDPTRGETLLSTAKRGESFLVQVYHALLLSTVHHAWAVGRLGGPVPSWYADGCITQRIRASAVAEGRTEVVRELLDDDMVWRTGPKTLARLPAKASLSDRDRCELVLKLLVHMLEEETRIWAAANSFQLVEVWRGVRRAEPSCIAAARLAAAVYCCTGGEGAMTKCEATPGFDMKYAKYLASRFRRQTLGVKVRGEKLHGQFVEGSVSIRGFAFVLDRVCRRARQSSDIMRGFVDLGSGFGLAVLAAHGLFPFRSCYGLELVKEYYDVALSYADKYMQNEHFHGSSAQSECRPEDLFVHGDIFEHDWSDASVVFCNAVTWPPEVIRQLALRALRLKPGAVFMLMSLSRFFPDDEELLAGFDFRSDACLVSWVNYPVGLWVYQRR